MASLSGDQCVQTPVRSISLPSRLHPSSLRAKAELAKLRTWDSSTSPLAAETIQAGLTKLVELFISLEDLIHSPLIASHANYHPDSLEEVIDGSVGLLDVCSSTRDLLSAMREHVHDLQSTLRRKGGDLCIEKNLQAYLSFRKKARKEMSKSLVDLKRMEARFGSFRPCGGTDHCLSFVMDVIREASATTVTIFRSTLLFFYQSSHSTGSGWSLVSKLIRSGTLVSDKGHHEKIFNRVESVDIAICSLYGKVRKNCVSKVDLKQVQLRLEVLDVTIRDIESKFDFLFRALVQHRVSLLNSVTP